VLIGYLEKEFDTVAYRKTCFTALRALALGIFLVLAFLCLWPHASMAQGALPTKWLYSPIAQAYTVVYSPDGTLLAVGGATTNVDSVVQIHTLATGAVLCLPTAASEVVTSVAFSPDGKTLAVGGRKHTYSTDLSTASYGAVLELWNVSTGKRIATLDTSVDYSDSLFVLGGVKSVAFSPDGTMLAAGGDSRTGSQGGGVVELWSVSGRTRIRTFPTTANAGIASVAFSPDGHTLADGGESHAPSTGVGIGVLEVWNVSDGTLFESLHTAAGNGVLSEANGVLSVAFSPDGKTLAVGGAKAPSNTVVLELRNISDGTLRATLTSVLSTHPIRALAFSATGRVLFVGTDANLEVFSAATGNLLSYYFQYPFSSGPGSIAVSPDGLLAYGTGFGALAVAAAPYSNSFLDFNGDGFTDLLLQNSTTGAIAAWYMNGSAQIGSAPFSLNPSPNYALVGVGDFAGDGTTTLVLQNRKDDTIAFWYTGGVNNTVITGGDYVHPNPFPGWKVVGVGDFNGDGKSDLVFQNRTTNQVVIWFMDGPVYQGGASLPYYPPVGWQVVGTGDFNGDGKSDLVFQNQTTGQIVVWYMDGVTYIGGTVLSAVPGPGWKVVGVGDYNQDGSPDLLFQNRTTHQAAVWYLQGSTLQGSANLSPFPPSGWSIVGPR
jgi:WD40 repeat protein